MDMLMVRAEGVYDVSHRFGARATTERAEIS